MNRKVTNHFILDATLPILGHAVRGCVAHVFEDERISTSSPELLKSAEGHAFKKEIVLPIKGCEAGTQSEKDVDKFVRSPPLRVINFNKGAYANRC